MVTKIDNAQVNVATTQTSLEDPLLAESMAKLDDVNELAERSPGNIWRLQSDSGNAADIRAFDKPLTIVNPTARESFAAHKRINRTERGG